jgi:hypothetical protein
MLTSAVYMQSNENCGSRREEMSEDAQATMVLLGLLKKERHAGPSYCNSPPAAELPVPSFIRPARSESSSPSPPNSPVSTLRFSERGNTGKGGEIPSGANILEVLLGKQAVAPSMF